jgi:hypothetical protein
VDTNNDGLVDDSEMWNRLAHTHQAHQDKEMRERLPTRSKDEFFAKLKVLLSHMCAPPPHD